MVSVLGIMSLLVLAKYVFSVLSEEFELDSVTLISIELSRTILDKQSALVLRVPYSFINYIIIIFFKF